MKKSKIVFFSILVEIIVSIIFVGSIGAFAPVKKHSLSALKEKIHQEQPKNEPGNAVVNVKRVRKNFSLLTWAMQVIENQKRSFAKKARLFYRHHPYLSVLGLGAISALSLYWLKSIGVPFMSHLIERYKNGQKPVEKSSQSEPIQKNPINDVVQRQEITQRETIKPLPQTIQEPVKNVADQEPVEAVQDQPIQNITQKHDQSLQLPDQPLNQKNEMQMNQAVQPQTQDLPPMEIGQPLPKKRSKQEILDSSDLYNKTKTFINETITNQINRLKELQNQYEIAKKRAQESPCNIQLHNDFLKKEQAVIEHKKQLVQATQKVAQKIDSSEFLNTHGIVKDLTEADLGKPRKAVISNNRALAFADAAAFEVYYGNVINENHQENFQNALKEQQKQHREFNYMSGILNKILLPFIQSL